MATPITSKKIVVTYAAEDQATTTALVKGLRNTWNVWFAEDLWHGEWRKKVQQEIRGADAIIPVLSNASASKRIFLDEWDYAIRLSKPTFPFCIEACEAPLGMGGHSRVDAHGWAGEYADAGFVSLRRKLAGHFLEDSRAAPNTRPRSVAVGTKSLNLPSFVFSISSFETQLDPVDGVELVAQLAAPACLISAYDTAEHVGKNRRAKFWRAIDAIRESESILFLDSGNYEASRKHDYRSALNPKGWSADGFYAAVDEVGADIVFSYDKLNPTGSVAKVTGGILSRYEKDARNTRLDPNTLSPVLHLPAAPPAKIPATAAEMATRVARALRPSLIAIPERELGDGILARMKAVKAMRSALNELDFYQPLHILGTGNPTSIAALAACGGDCFDGLEWCRTAANYDNNNLLHFQHFDLLQQSFAGRITNPDVRNIVETPSLPFVLRAASYNYDYFCEWTRTIQDLLHSGQAEFLLRSIPFLGPGLVVEMGAK